MKMSDDLFDSINRRVVLWRGVDVASIEIYAICVYSIMTSSHSIRVENRKKIKNKLVSQ